MSDPDRIAEFLNFYDENELSAESQEALFALILASFEDAVWALKFDEALWLRTCAILCSNYAQFKKIISIWTSDVGRDGFAITKRLRAAEITSLGSMT